MLWTRTPWRESSKGRTSSATALAPRTSSRRSPCSPGPRRTWRAALKPQQLLIAVTGVGAGDSKGHGGFFYDRLVLPLVVRRIYADKDRQEEIIRRRVARWIIVRPGLLTNGPRTGRYRALVDLEGVRGGTISRADVADFILKQAKSPEFLGKTPLLIY